jgi:hypothetical protein
VFAGPRTICEYGPAYDVQDGYHLWSERYDRDLKDIFEDPG